MNRNIPDCQTERKRWIKHQLKIKGLSLAELGRQNGCDNRHVVSSALSRPYPRWEHVIALALELSPQDLWPERYDSAGIPKVI